MSSKPEFVLVPGGWHSPDSFAPTTVLLEKAGYNVHGVHLPSVGASSHHQSNRRDVLAIRDVVTKLLSEGKDIVIVMHSYGGTVGCEALAPYMQDLEKGGKANWGGKVVRLVFCTAFVLNEGGSLIKALNGKPLPWFIINEDETEVKAGTPKEIFYNDISDEQAAPQIAQLKPQGYKTFFDELTVAPWKVIPSTFVMCELDNAIPISAQQGMVERAREVVSGCFDVMVRCGAGHSPFLSRPEWLAGRLVEAAGGDAEGGCGGGS